MHCYLEHANITVADANRTANCLCSLFGWQIRWSGEAINGGFSVHVGEQRSYLALYSHAGGKPASCDSLSHFGSLNHIGVVVGDLAIIEAKVIAAGYQPTNHADYEPGKRFYFMLEEDFEVEVASYN